MTQDIEAIVIKAVRDSRAGLIGVSVTPSTALDVLDVDSLDRVEIAMELERVFGIAIPEGEEANTETVQDFINLVKGQLQ